MKFIFIPLLFLGTLLFADEQSDVLTLKKVIKLSQKKSFDQNDIILNSQLIDANLRQYGQNYKPNIYLDGRVGKEQNIVASENKLVNDNFAYIVWKNNIYNTKADIQGTIYQNQKLINKLKLDESMHIRKIKAMQYFFDLKLASFYHQYVLEVLAMKAIYRNRVKDVAPVGRSSDVDLLDKDAQMYLASANNFKAEQEIFLKKQQLTDYLGIDFYSINTIETPDVKYYLDKKILDSDKLKVKAYKHDAYLIQLDQKLKNIKQELQLLGGIDFNINSTVMYGHEDQKSLNNNDSRYEARINLNIPLYDGGAKNYQKEILKIKYKKTENKINQYKQIMGQRIEQLLVKLAYLKKKHKATSASLDYYDLYLEKARLLYQQDRASDLGDSLSRLSLAEYNNAKTLYDYAINYENLNFLTGVDNETK